MAVKILDPRPIEGCAYCENKVQAGQKYGCESVKLLSVCKLVFVYLRPRRRHRIEVTGDGMVLRNRSLRTIFITLRFYVFTL